MSLIQLFVNTVKVFLTNLRKWKVFFFIDYGSSAFILRFDLAQIVFCSTLQALERELLGV